MVVSSYLFAVITHLSILGHYVATGGGCSADFSYILRPTYSSSLSVRYRALTLV
jgi:hypothetical protein